MGTLAFSSHVSTAPPSLSTTPRLHLKTRETGRETDKRGRGCIVYVLAMKRMTSALFGATTSQSTAGQNHRGEQKNRGRTECLVEEGNNMLKLNETKETTGIK